MVTTVLFFLLAGVAIACAGLTVYYRNPLYSALSLIGVFISLAVLYLTLAAPFIAITQILVYAGAIMVLVVFVIMLLNLDEERPLNRLKHLYFIGGGLGAAMLAQAFFIFYAVLKTPKHVVDTESNAGSTMSIGTHMYTEYLLPVEIVGVMLLMAIIGAVMLVRKDTHASLEAAAEKETND
ncbi:MAG: NADH-quinone oxidoreductase subunit J [Acidobacteria bacterium]|nr:NADH-quinone oxidoreductase subunit J [Acidobacteriota bacterium]